VVQKKNLLIALNQKVSITVTITQNCAINYIQLTHNKHQIAIKNTRTLDEMKKTLG